ncbi:MAG: tetratricopeptide repeat protein [Candidatus Competibacterales bacterium]
MNTTNAATERHERRHRWLLNLAIVLTVAWVAWALYDYLSTRQPGDNAYFAGQNAFADQNYSLALVKYDEALAEAPDHRPAKAGRAETLILLEREAEAIALYEQLLTDTENPVMRAAYLANRGIALDRSGRHREALASYRQALALDRQGEVLDGPHWLTRFLRNQPERPPGIAERAAYLEAQLALPEEERVLRVEDVDEAQRPYKK